jgi:FkbM family methyltransferase
MTARALTRSTVRRAGTVLLAHPSTRRLMRAWYALGPGAGRELFVRCFRMSDITRSFLWEVAFPAGHMRVPVSPEYPQSWGMALGCLSDEPALFPLYEAFIRLGRGDRVFFDVGANHGTHSFRFLAAGYRCVLFEPQTPCTRFMRAVAHANGWAPVIEEVALSDRAGEATFYVSDMTWYSSFSREHVEIHERAHPMAVRRDTLDAASRRIGLHPSLFKIDVEGAEAAVVVGGQRTIEEARPAVVVEMLRGARSRQPLFEFFTRRGYTVTAVRTGALVPIVSAGALEACQDEDFLFCPDTALPRDLMAALRW